MYVDEMPDELSYSPGRQDRWALEGFVRQPLQPPQNRSGLLQEGLLGRVRAVATTKNLRRDATREVTAEGWSCYVPRIPG